MDPQFFRKLNELAFSEQAEVTSTPEAAPQKESLLASVYRLMTAPFTIRTPKNITTRTRKRKSSPIKLGSPTEITGTNEETERCEKSIMD